MTVKRICEKYFREFETSEKFSMHGLSDMRRWMDGRTDGRKCNDIVLSHDRKTYFEKILHVSACVV